uniref:Uncharacterized protein n=1 Tax=Tanacetum cinerariifolium TaxID=118510 RepID=A0A699Q2L4_TANCI|nr:hypothetical protein [Tanacetum cinerariifolium]
MHPKPPVSYSSILEGNFVCISGGIEGGTSIIITTFSMVGDSVSSVEQATHQSGTEDMKGHLAFLVD